MKKSLAFILFLILIYNLSAIGFEIKEKYSQGESIIAKISGNFPEGLAKEDVFFYRGNTRIPMDYDLSKINEDYYLYVNLFDKTTGNYTIALEDIKTQIAQKITQEDILKTFTITNNTADFSINKGFIITEDNFLIKIMNLVDEKINISYSYILKGTESIGVGEEKDIKVSVENAELLKINILEIISANTKYEIPVYVLGIPEDKNEVISLSFDERELNISLDINNKTKRIVYLKNTGVETALQVRLTLSENLEKYMVLSKNEIDNLSAGLLYPIELLIVSPEIPKNLNGSLIASSSGSNTILNIRLKFIPGYIESVKDKQSSSLKTCSQMNGTLCESINCKGEYFITTEGNCCLSLCEKEQGNSSWSTLGWFILILIVIFILWVYFQKYRKAQGSPQGLFKILKKE